MDSRLEALAGQILTASALATQPDQGTFIETLIALPEPTAFDLGRFIIVQLPGETLTSSYVGTLGPDDIVFWQRLAFGVGAGGATSPEFTFIGNVSVFGLAHQGVWANASTVYMVLTAQSNVYQYAKAGGVTSIKFAGIGNAQAITVDGSGNFYLAQPGSTRIRKYNSAGGLLDTTTTAKTYNSVFHTLGSGHILATSAVNNEWYKIQISTMDTLNTFSTSISAPEGICEDSAGNIYVANTGANTIRKYNSALTFQIAWGTAGSGDGQFSTIRQMWVDSSDRIYVADSGNDRVQVFDSAGTFLGKFAASGSGTAELDNPSSVYGSANDIEVADTGNSRLSRWTRT